jgi:ABC-2 type transport system permease protein
MAAGQVIYTLWLREMKWLIRAKSRLVASVVQPFLWLAIIGIGMSATFGKIPGTDITVLKFMAPGIIGMTLIFSSTMAGVSVLWDKQFGFMKEILVAPVPRIQIMLGKAIGGMTTSILQGLLLLLAATALGVGPSGIVGLLQILAFMVLISLTFVSIGLAFASRMEDPVAFPIVMNFLIMPLYFLSGALYMTSVVPGWLSFLSRLDPLTYGVDGMRTAILGTPQLSQYSIWMDFAVIGVFAVAMILLGGYLFKKIKA